ncbi:MAG: hypothetical protein V5A23_04750 [Halobacteriales archaeon]
MAETGPRSQGDPRVLFVMNLVLSLVFSYVIVWGLDFIGTLTFSWQTVGFATVALMLVTHVMIMQ